MLQNDNREVNTRKFTIEDGEQPDDPHRLARRFIAAMAERKEKLTYKDGVWTFYQHGEAYHVSKKFVRTVLSTHIQSDLRLKKVHRRLLADAMLALKSQTYLFPKD